MARTFAGTVVFNGSTNLARSLRAVSTLRLVLGLTALLGAIIFLEGTSWDIQWHSYIGRDRTLIPPHLMMLSGVALSGISGLLTVLIESWWARRNTIIAEYSSGFAQIFSGPLGAYIVAFTRVAAAYAIPWRWAATSVSACYLLLAGIMAVFVQPATDWLLTVEHLKYREAPPFTSVVALEWFLTPVIVAILIDVIMHRA